MKRRVIITGITGQDGSYMAEHLLKLGYEIHGLVRRQSQPNYINLKYCKEQIVFHYGDMLDQNSLNAVLKKVQPDEIYNFAAQSFVGASWCIPQYTMSVNTLGTLNLLEAVRLHSPASRIYQASSSEQFGPQEENLVRIRIPINENFAFHPCSPYGISKTAAHHFAVHYRQAYGLWVECGIAFNHESPRRGPEFVTRKITQAVAAIYNKKQEELKLGALNTWRDWGYAGDYVQAMHLMLQKESPRDYVIATGEAHSIQEFADIAFEFVGLNSKEYVSYDPTLSRPADIEYLCGNPHLIQQDLPWKPETKFKDLVQQMVTADLEVYSKL